MPTFMDDRAELPNYIDVATNENFLSVQVNKAGDRRFILIMARWILSDEIQSNFTEAQNATENILRAQDQSIVG
jgi:hypothetical protein